MAHYQCLLSWFNNIKNTFLYRTLYEIKKEFESQIPISKYTIFAIGSFDEKIVIVYKEKKHVLIFSIDKPINNTTFLKKYIQQIEYCVFNEFVIQVGLDLQFIKSLYSPKIALLSLAKNDVYTFPRFALGISDIAHAVRTEFEGVVELYDLQLNPNINDFITSIKNKNTDIVGISMTFGLFDVLEQVLNAIYKENLRCIITVGGSLAAITYKQILEKFPQVIVSLSEGETSIKQIIRYYKGQCKIEEINGIAFMDKNTIRQTPVCKLSSTSEISLPELDLLLPTLRAKEVFQLETSRGCYNACTFCPRKQKGIWRGRFDDVKKIEYLLNYFCYTLKNAKLEPQNFIVYVVDEEFVGGEDEEHQTRAIEISKILAKNKLKYETSFRMNTIYNHSLPYEKNLKKAETIIKLKKNGLNRVLVGVESGVQSVLERFNKNVTSEENIAGIRLLTGLDIPIRFTYITFDPLMTLQELKETYFFQGRKDLLLKPCYKDEPAKLLNAVIEKREIAELSKEIPFYSQVPYMLVSLECLIGSQYLNVAINNNLSKNKIIMALGKEEIAYLDKRIGKMSYFSQLWIDRNFAVDYSLKSLSKIYPHEISIHIRQQRILLKDYAYQLLGKMLYIIEPHKKFLCSKSEADLKFLNKLSEQYLCTKLLDNVFANLLQHQFELLIKEIDAIKMNLKYGLSNNDYKNICQQIDIWSNQTNWQLLHNT